MSQIPNGLKCEITVEEAYPNGVPEIPEGWEFARFVFGGHTEEDESVLELNGSLYAVPLKRHPHIIVRRKHKTRRWLVECHEEFNLQNGKYLTGAKIREVKPVTRDQLRQAGDKAMNQYTVGPYNSLWLQLVLIELGIEVEQ